MNISEKENNHICGLCGHEETKCSQEKHEKTGFSLSLFTNFTSEGVFGQIDDSIKTYINTQSIIF